MKLLPTDTHTDHRGPWKRGTLVLASLMVLANPLTASAQGCALCYTQAASAGQKMIEALRSGILIMIIPPTLAMIALLFVIHHTRNQVRGAEDGEGSNLGW